jgi:DNA topoisomerase VI subunit B
MFDTPRASEYFTVGELQAQTGQPARRFFHVALKELVDNSLDAAESAKVAPQVAILIVHNDPLVGLSVSDNGVGLSPKVIDRILCFDTRTSDKAAYRSPTRGLQGNAGKTLVGMPDAFGIREPLIIESQGVRHTIRAWLDPAGEVRIDHEEEPCDRHVGTKISLVLPLEGQEFAPEEWATAFAAFNPHASIKIAVVEAGIELCSHG